MNKYKRRLLFCIPLTLLCVLSAILIPELTSHSEVSIGLGTGQPIIGVIQIYNLSVMDSPCVYTGLPNLYIHYSEVLQEMQNLIYGQSELVMQLDSSFQDFLSIIKDSSLICKNMFLSSFRALLNDSLSGVDTDLIISSFNFDDVIIYEMQNQGLNELIMGPIALNISNELLNFRDTVLMELNSQSNIIAIQKVFDSNQNRWLIDEMATNSWVELVILIFMMSEFIFYGSLVLDNIWVSRKYKIQDLIKILSKRGTHDTPTNMRLRSIKVFKMNRDIDDNKSSEVINSDD
jgi:hypothetical protein